MTEDAQALAELAAACADRVGAGFGVRLDYSVESLAGLDDVCATLLEDGPLAEPGLDDWFRLVGAYTGEVLVRAYGGRWIMYEDAFAVEAGGVKAFPFGIAFRVLNGEPYKSLASFGRSLPAIIARS